MIMPLILAALVVIVGLVAIGEIDRTIQHGAYPNGM